MVVTKRCSISKILLNFKTCVITLYLFKIQFKDQYKGAFFLKAVQSETRIKVQRFHLVYFQSLVGLQIATGKEKKYGYQNNFHYMLGVSKPKSVCFLNQLYVKAFYSLINTVLLLLRFLCNDPF